MLFRWFVDCWCMDTLLVGDAFTVKYASATVGMRTPFRDFQHVPKWLRFVPLEVGRDAICRRRAIRLTLRRQTKVFEIPPRSAEFLLTNSVYPRTRSNKELGPGTKKNWRAPSSRLAASILSKSGRRCYRWGERSKPCSRWWTAWPRLC